MKLIFIISIFILLIILLVIPTIVRYYKVNKDTFNNNKDKKAICILTTKLSDTLYNFVIDLKNSDTNNLYDYYICVDKILDNKDFLKYNKDNINIINIDSNIPESYGFKGSVLYFLKNACSRDKGLYYFSMINTSYNHIWFIEEDVFFYNLNTIIRMDNKYNDSIDLLLRDLTIKKEKEPLNWHWPKVDGKIDLPWACGMICVIRISKKLLEKIKEYALKNKTLFLDEALFSTIALHNNLKIDTPVEFSTIYENDWRKMDENNWDKNKLINSVNKDNFLHPVKKLEEQIEHREMVKNKYKYELVVEAGFTPLEI
jgi:hypothetical protein